MTAISSDGTDISSDGSAISDGADISSDVSAIKSVESAV